MKETETIVEMITRFTEIVNGIEALGRVINESEKVMKILRSLPSKWHTKVTAIQEAKDLTKLPMEELLGSLMTYEISLTKQLQESEDKKKKSIALKATTKEEEDVEEEKPSEEDDDLALITRKLNKYMRGESQRRMKKAMMATWSESEESSEEEKEKEVANMCFMAIDDLDEGSKEDKWFLDSGCSRHMTGDESKFAFLTKRKGGYVTFGDNAKERIIGQGLETSMGKLQIEDKRQQEKSGEDPKKEGSPLALPPPQQVQGESSQDLPKDWKFVINHLQDQIIGNPSSGCMHSEFEMSMMGELNFFLGLQIKQLKEGIFINKAKYIKDLLKRFNMEEAKVMKTPMSSSIKLDMDEKGDNFELIGFSDADFAGCRVERKSTSDTCHFLGHSLVSWHSKKQNSVALSTAEAECIAADFEARVSSLDGFGLRIWTGSSLFARHLLVLLISRAPRAYSGQSSLFACSLQFSELISIFGFWMAPRKETGTSRVQGKRPAEPSQQSEQTEARRKARYDTALFDLVEDYQRYKTHFAKRKVVLGRNINFSQLQSLGFEGLFIRMGWLSVVTVSEPIFPTLVRAFYSRMTYGLGGPIRTTVRGVEIELSPKSICRILDIPPVGLRVYEAKAWPTIPGFEPREAIQRLCGLADAHGMGKPSAHSLIVPSRVLHHMICSILLPRGGHRDEVSYYEAFLAPHECFPTAASSLVSSRIDARVDLSRETEFEAPNIYDTYDEHSLGRMKLEKAPDGSWVRKAERQARGHDQIHPGVEEEDEIREMEDGLDPQRDLEQRGPELDIPPPHQSEGIHVEATFSEPMMTEPSFPAGPSSQPSFTELPSQAPHAPDHPPWMDLSAHISSLGTRMEELAVVHDTRFYSMEDRIDQYQVGFTS
ncbi:hypothetical protein CK203_077069 [Vitis vinifera]|uniref:Uncharacterized protein n=1 Tax=Vitis vinifera TaxID=29760 RepID=A0A438DIU2_VITVI|nr:hypothetical protein CK203_077069 [Vitis vinifera]